MNIYLSCFSHVNSIWIGHFIQKNLLRKRYSRNSFHLRDIVINHSGTEVPLQASVMLNEEALKEEHNTLSEVTSTLSNFPVGDISLLVTVEKNLLPDVYWGKPHENHCVNFKGKFNTSKQ